MTWTLHLVGKELESKLEELMPTIIKDIEAAGHILIKAELGTDAGTRSLGVTGEPVAESEEVVGDSSNEHVVTEEPMPEATYEDPTKVPTDTPPSL